MINIPSVKLPRPNPASSLSPIRPQVAALTTVYMGWNNIPNMGSHAVFMISLIESMIVGYAFDYVCCKTPESC